MLRVGKNLYGGEPEWINDNPLFSEFTGERREELQFTIPNNFFLFFVCFKFPIHESGGRRRKLRNSALDMQTVCACLRFIVGLLYSWNFLLSKGVIV